MCVLCGIFARTNQQRTNRKGEGATGGVKSVLWGVRERAGCSAICDSSFGLNPTKDIAHFFGE